MSDRPILFSAPMVRALIDGRKSQTRRLLKGVPSWVDSSSSPGYSVMTPPGHIEFRGLSPEGYGAKFVRLPYAPGDRLWVREAHSLHGAHGQSRNDGRRWGPWGGLPTTVSPDGTKIVYYREGFDRCDPGRWRSSIHMPRWASRLTLTVTDVRVQRLQEISAEDCAREGVVIPDHVLVRDGFMLTARKHFRDLWNSIHGPGAWNANPWVCALTFSVERRNIDAGEVAP